MCCAGVLPNIVDPQGALTWVFHTSDLQARQGGKRGMMSFLLGGLRHLSRLLHPFPARTMQLTLHFNITRVPTMHHPLTSSQTHTSPQLCSQDTHIHPHTYRLVHSCMFWPQGEPAGAHSWLSLPSTERSWQLLGLTQAEGFETWVQTLVCTPTLTPSE